MVPRIIFLRTLRVAASLTGVAIAITGCGRTTSTTDAPSATVNGNLIVFPVSAPQLSSLVIAAATARSGSVLRLTGRLVWDEDKTVRIYTPVGGRVRSVNVELGAAVAPEAVLAVLDSPDFGQAQADARKATADLALAERTLTRLRDLFEHGAAPRKDLDAAENAEADAQAERDRASAKLALYGSPTAGTGDQIFSLRTPLGGVVVDKNINPGQELRSDLMLANATQLLAPQFVVSNPRQLWVLLDVAETDLSAIHPGQSLRVLSRAYADAVFSGHLDLVGDALDPATRTVQARGSVENSDGRLKAGMYVTVEIVGEAQSGVEVPSAAVFLKDDKSYVYLERGPGRFERSEVKLGTETDGRIAVLSGITAGQRVVTEGCLLLQSTIDSGGQP
jgi:cobalt-zinc-cadmium efflux system membrane fusion protein